MCTSHNKFSSHLMSKSAVAVSAPGKVLFTGGFLVLDRKHTGLVFGLNARIHVHIQPWHGDDLGERSNNDKQNSLILVQSPQFRDARWLYQIGGTADPDSKAVVVKQVVNHENYSKTSNKFVELTLLYVLTYLSHLSKNICSSSRITILADDDYYSQSEAGSGLRKDGFSDFGVSLSQAHKTGLGSSAALVTALVAAMLTYYAEPTSHTLPQKTIHNLAQAAHCAAQGKVGSGFDVAAAVYGSCLYRRFTPAILEHVGEPSDPAFGERLHQCVDDLQLDHKWNAEVSDQSVRIPESLLLIMCDVDCGSETPGMVRKVLQWRKENAAEADFLWTAIQQGSDDLGKELLRLSQMESIKGDYRELGDILQTIRSLVREESQKSGVPIEPEVITELLDFCTDTAGVVGGVAPGAGGYDAVALLVKNDAEVVRALEAKLKHWKGREASTGATIGKVRLLNVKQDKEGVRMEAPSRHEGWVQA